MLSATIAHHAGPSTRLEEDLLTMPAAPAGPFLEDGDLPILPMLTPPGVGHIGIESTRFEQRALTGFLHQQPHTPLSNMSSPASRLSGNAVNEKLKEGELGGGEGAYLFDQVDAPSTWKDCLRSMQDSASLFLSSPAICQPCRADFH